MAWVYRRGPRWYVAYRDEVGKLVRKATRARFKPQAEKLAAELEAAAELVRMGLRKRFQPHTWEELCDKWERDVLPNLRANETRAGEMRRVLRPAFAGRLLHTIGAGEVDAWVTGLRATLSDSTRALYRMRLNALFAMAIRLDWLALNPVSRSARVKVLQKAPPFLTAAEVRKVLEVAPDYFRPVLATAFYCGLRRGELAGLKWEDVDFAQGVIHVRRSFHGATKGSREDVVPLPRALVPYLEEARRLRPSEWCFPTRAGEARPRWNASEAFAKVLRKAGITRPLTFHATRHTWATHFYAATRDPRAVQQLARHSNARTTEKYVHLLEDSLQKHANALSYGDALPRRFAPLHKSSTAAQKHAARARKRPGRTRG